MSKKQYERGARVENLSELLEHDFFIMSMPDRDKTIHSSFVKSWQLKMCDDFIRHGRLYVAEKIRSNSVSQLSKSPLSEGTLPQSAFG